MKIFKFVLVILIFFTAGNISLYSQYYNNLRADRKHGFSLQIGGDIGTVVGLSYDCFITPVANVELNLNLVFPGLGASFKYHPLGAKNTLRWSPYIGVHAGFNRVVFCMWGCSKSYFGSIYFPLGVNYISPRGFNFSLDLGLVQAMEWDFIDYLDRGWVYDYYYRPFFSIKLGYRLWNPYNYRYL